MFFQLVDLDKYLIAADTQKQVIPLPATLYNVQIYSGVTPDDLEPLRQILLYLNRKYPFISWFLAVSTTDPKSAKKETIRTGKRGRPRTIITGTKTDQHFHIGIIGDADNSGRPAALEAAKNINKKLSTKTGGTKKLTRAVSMQGLGIYSEMKFINYSIRQADSFYQGGSFDFKRQDAFYLAN